MAIIDLDSLGFQFQHIYKSIEWTDKMFPPLPPITVHCTRTYKKIDHPSGIRAETSKGIWWLCKEYDLGEAVIDIKIKTKVQYNRTVTLKVEKNTPRGHDRAQLLDYSTDKLLAQFDFPHKLG